MKIIDLLSKIANREEVPEKIKVHDIEYHKCILKTGIDYKIYSDDFYYLSNDICKAGFSLNDEVEIIEDKKIDKLDYCKITDETISGLRGSINQLNKDFTTKINEIIDYLEEKK